MSYTLTEADKAEIERIYSGHCDGVVMRMRDALEAIALHFYERGRLAEREACAKVCDDYPKRDPGEDGNGYWAAENCAAALRSRGEAGR